MILLTLIMYSPSPYIIVLSLLGTVRVKIIAVINIVDEGIVSVDDRLMIRLDA